MPEHSLYSNTQKRSVQVHIRPTKKPAQLPPCRFLGFDAGTSILSRDDLFLIIRSAALADSVRHHQCAALAALNKSRSRHFPVRSSLISVASGRFVLRANRHQYHLLLFIVPETRTLDYRRVALCCQAFLYRFRRDQRRVLSPGCEQTVPPVAQLRPVQ